MVRKHCCRPTRVPRVCACTQILDLTPYTLHPRSWTVEPGPYYLNSLHRGRSRAWRQTCLIYELSLDTPSRGSYSYDNAIFHLSTLQLQSSSSPVPQLRPATIKNSTDSLSRMDNSTPNPHSCPTEARRLAVQERGQPTTPFNSSSVQTEEKYHWHLFNNKPPSVDHL